MRIPLYPHQDTCRICGKIIESGGRDILCGECRCGNRPHFDRAVNALVFDDVARRMVIDYKFNNHIWLRDDFVDFMEGALRSRIGAPSVDVILPMPITLFHRCDRGFNQCEYLAKALAKRIERHCDTSILRRAGAPRRQAGLSRDERLVNVKGTFAVKKPELVVGRTILVLDDVMTTGATLSEAAKTLKANGAWRVFAITLARPIADI